MKLLALKGCIVTIDAGGTQAAVADQIVAAGADYVLALKSNQKGLAEDVVRLYEWADSIDFAALAHDRLRTTTRGTGGWRSAPAGRLLTRVTSVICARSPMEVAALGGAGDAGTPPG